MQWILSHQNQNLYHNLFLHFKREFYSHSRRGKLVLILYLIYKSRKGWLVTPLTLRNDEFVSVDLFIVCYVIFHADSKNVNYIALSSMVLELHRHLGFSGI